jgi:hypothetical protein
MNINLENFGSAIKPVDLILYAGVAIVLYVLFQEKINALFNNIKDKIKKAKPPSIPNVDAGFFDNNPITHDDIFFELIKSWKQTRDLAEQYGAHKAVQIADQMFPHLVPKDEAYEEQ